jgi:RNA polymerase sigma factor (sigma-70 family)
VRLRLGRASRPEDVEDLAAEVWTVALRRLPDLEPREGRHAPVLVRFLGTTALQLANNFLRSRIRRARRGDASPGDATEGGSRTIDRVSAAGRGAVTIAALGEVRRRVDECLGRLSPEKRDVVVLRIMEQRSNQDIAAMLGIPANTVAVRYRRALEDLRRCLPEAVFDEIWSSRR